jgi:peroxiredoxin
MRRLTAFEAALPLYRSQNVQVLGVTVDDPAETIAWAKSIGVTFPILTDTDGALCKAFDLFEVSTKRAAKALALVYDGRVVHREKVKSTDIPVHVRPWIARFLEQQ